MINIHSFVFNAIEVNTYVLFDESRNALVIDPAFYYENEVEEFDNYIQQQSLQITEVVFTHPHSDHIVGGEHIINKYGIVPRINSNSRVLVAMAEVQADVIGFSGFKLCKMKYDLEDGSKIYFGDSYLDVIYTPGHADGSVCFYNAEEKILFTGDVLFRSSIGRTDFPTGDYELLIDNIKTKIFILPDDVKVFPGHNAVTTLKFEKRFNPFFNS